MKKLDSSEIDRIYSFTRQHYVVYYDVQTELVDHLANGIEAQWKENPEVSFEEALQREFKKFGIYGFSDVVEQREQAMQKKYFRLILKQTTTLLRKPSVLLLFIMLFLSCFFVLKLEGGFNYIMYFILAYFSVLATVFSIRSFSLKKKKREKKKIFLLEAVIFNAGSCFSFFWFTFYTIHLSLNLGNIESVYLHIFLSALISFLILLSFICFYHLPKRKDEILQKAHPEIKFLQ